MNATVYGVHMPGKMSYGTSANKLHDPNVKQGLLATMPFSKMYPITPGHEGRIGMAAVTIKEGREFDCSEAFTHVANYLPSYARPRFIRIKVVLWCIVFHYMFKLTK